MHKKFLFVCGCPRSGTSYFQSILAWHPAIALGMERFNLRLFAGKLLPSDFERERFFRMEAGDTWYDDLSHFPWPQRVMRHGNGTGHLGIPTGGRARRSSIGTPP